MFFLQATQAPVEVRMGDKIVSVPKLDLDELVVWATEVQTERASKVTEDMDEGQRRQFEAYFPALPPDLQQMAVLARTPEGIKRTLQTCFTKPDVKSRHFKTGEPTPNPTEQELAQYLKNGAGRLAGLAWALCDLMDESQKNPYNDGEDKEGNKDPLKRSGKGDSKA